MDMEQDLAVIVLVKPNVEIINISSSSEDDGAARREAKHEAEREAEHEAEREAEREARRAAKRAAKRAAREAAARRAVKLTRRGPRIQGREPYDEHCVFPNLVSMNPEQVKYLKRVVRYKNTSIPLYVCTIKEANILTGKAKMVFTRKFSMAYISKKLELPADVKVYSRKGERIAKVRMIMGKGKGTCVQITTNWTDVVKETEMKMNDIFIFRFREISSCGLKLYVVKLK